MSDGYEPEQRSEKPFDRLWAAFICVCWCAIGGLIGCGILTYEVTGLATENAALSKELDWWTCREQTEIKPVLDGQGSPTLIEEGK